MQNRWEHVLRRNDEPVFFKMFVKSKRPFDLKRLHDLKTNAIHETDIPVVLCQKALHALGIPFVIDPDNFDEG
jgi:hypothetical protein